jgi:hypothetical protein
MDNEVVAALAHLYPYYLCDCVFRETVQLHVVLRGLSRAERRSLGLAPHTVRRHARSDPSKAHERIEGYGVVAKP